MKHTTEHDNTNTHTPSCRALGSSRRVRQDAECRLSYQDAGGESSDSDLRPRQRNSTTARHGRRDCSSYLRQPNRQRNEVTNRCYNSTTATKDNLAGASARRVCVNPWGVGHIAGDNDAWARRVYVEPSEATLRVVSTTAISTQ
jgi:hypothetical protein